MPLAVRTFLTDNRSVTGHEFIRKLKSLGKMHGVAVVLDASRGKGSHRTVYYGKAFTVIRDLKSELKTGTLSAMCSQLGIKPSDLWGV
jgi:mRNA interferase HicA